MVLAAAWVRGDALHARVRGVIDPFALLAVRVPHRVGVLLLKLLRRDLLAKLSLPEEHRLFQRQADALEVQLQLPPALVAKVVILLHLPEEVLGAERERLGGGFVEVLEGDHLADLAVGALLAVVATDVPLGQGHDHGREAVLLLARDVLRPPPARHRRRL